MSVGVTTDQKQTKKKDSRQSYFFQDFLKILFDNWFG
jgi:hypothetical protein